MSITTFRFEKFYLQFEIVYLIVWFIFFFFFKNFDILLLRNIHNFSGCAPTLILLLFCSSLYIDFIIKFSKYWPQWLVKKTFYANVKRITRPFFFLYDKILIIEFSLSEITDLWFVMPPPTLVSLYSSSWYFSICMVHCLILYPFWAIVVAMYSTSDDLANESGRRQKILIREIILIVKIFW